MTPEQHIEQAQVRITWATEKRAGKPVTLECRTHNGKWYECRDDDPSFSGEYMWRLKPQPQRWTVCRHHLDALARNEADCHENNMVEVVEVVK